MTVKDRYAGIQTIFGVCNVNGCHFLTLCSIIEDYNRISNPSYTLDTIDAIRVSQSKGWFTPEFEGKDALAFLNYYTGKTWSRKEVKTLPNKIEDNEYTEVVFYNPRTKFRHFRRRYVDTLVDSVTVREGIVEKYYIYTVR